MKYLSLFSGVGGFELGIHRATEDAGCFGYSEIDKYAIQTYEKNWKGHTNYGDAARINPEDLPDFDLLVGGFPCQAFSIAGKRKGFDDTRGTLFFDIARILAHKRPRHLVLENVKGLLSHDSGKTIQTIAQVLSDLGYRIEWQVLNAKNFGVPQNRERIFIVGHLRGECAGQIFPITADNQKATFGTIHRSYHKGQHTGSYVATAPTLRATEHKRGDNQTSVVEPDARIRRLTPRECERLMSWEDDYTAGVSDTQRYKQCGNGVVSNVVQAVIEKMLEVKCL